MPPRRKKQGPRLPPEMVAAYTGRKAGARGGKGKFSLARSQAMRRHWASLPPHVKEERIAHLRAHCFRKKEAPGSRFRTIGRKRGAERMESAVRDVGHVRKSRAVKQPAAVKALTARRNVPLLPGATLMERDHEERRKRLAEQLEEPLRLTRPRVGPGAEMLD